MATLHEKMRAALMEEPKGKMLRNGKQAWSAEQVKKYATLVSQQKAATANEMDQLLGAFQAVSLAEQPAAAPAARPVDPMAQLEAAMAALGMGQQGGRRHRKSHRKSHRKARRSRKAHRKSRRHH